MGAYYYLPGQAVVQYATPTTGSTVTVVTGTTALLLNPAGTLVALTVALPSSPVDGQSITIATSQILSALTVSGGTLVGTLTTMALGGFARLVYGATAGVWFRAG